jgi:hypothetical protein
VTGFMVSIKQTYASNCHPFNASYLPPLTITADTPLYMCIFEFPDYCLTTQTPVGEWCDSDYTSNDAAAGFRICVSENHFKYFKIYRQSRPVSGVGNSGQNNDTFLCSNSPQVCSSNENTYGCWTTSK